MSTHRNNKFSQLSPEDRATLLRWCESHTYAEIARMCAEPRPIGLGLQTSAAALCRFYTRHNETVRATEIAAQLARCLNIKHAGEQNVFFAAILATLEQSIFVDMTKNAAPLDRVLPGIRTMMQMRRLRLAEQKKKFQAPSSLILEEEPDTAAETDFRDAIASKSQPEPITQPVSAIPVCATETEPTAAPAPEAPAVANPSATPSANLTPMPPCPDQPLIDAVQELRTVARSGGYDNFSRGLSALLDMAAEGLLPGFDPEISENPVAIPA